MTLTRPQKIGLIAAAVLVVVAIIVVVVTRSGGDQTNTNTPTDNTGIDINSLPEANTQPVNTNTEEPTATDPAADPADESTQATLMRLSRIVVERYGSYSNRNNYENITRLEPFMTDRFKEESIAFIDEQQKTGFSEEFYGIVTSAESVKVQEFKKQESATIIVSTRRVESRSNQEDKVITQDALVFFTYVGDNWKVDNITWQ